MGVTRFPNGVTNVPDTHIMRDLPIPDPTSVNQLNLDFDTWYPNGMLAAFTAAADANDIPYRRSPDFGRHRRPTVRCSRHECHQRTDSQERHHDFH